MILGTTDGGQTWQPIRGGDRRAAVLAISTRPSQIPFALLTKLSGDEGYRSAVYLPARQDVGPDGIDFANADLQMAEAVAVAGGSFAETGWQLPLAIPGLERNSERLLADWNARTENRLASVFLDDLVRQLKTWRPDVIVLDETPEDDALAKWLAEAIPLAVKQAADPTLHIAHQEHAGLNPWTVRKIYQRLPAASVGDAHLDPHEYLPRRKTSLQNATALASSRIQSISRDPATREAYRLLYEGTPSAASQSPHREFLPRVVHCSQHVRPPRRYCPLIPNRMPGAEASYSNSETSMPMPNACWLIPGIRCKSLANCGKSLRA